MKTFKILSGVFTLIFIVTFNTECAKTDDVEPIVLNSNSNNDSTNNDTTSVTIADDTVYINSSILGFLLNEVLYDPPAGNAGDANQDGTRHAQEDEFVEFVNNTDSCIEISGCKIFDDDSYVTSTHKHQFPNNTFVNPNQAVVVFGGPQGATFNPSSFGNALVFSASESLLNLNTSGDKMWFTDSLNNVLINFDISQYQADNNVNQSYTRNPDLTGPFEQHSGISGTLFSPGTRIDGSTF